MALVFCGPSVCHIWRLSSVLCPSVTHHGRRCPVYCLSVTRRIWPRNSSTKYMAMLVLYDKLLEPLWLIGLNVLLSDVTLRWVQHNVGRSERKQLRQRKRLRTLKICFDWKIEIPFNKTLQIQCKVISWGKTDTTTISCRLISTKLMVKQTVSACRFSCRAHYTTPTFRWQCGGDTAPLSRTTDSTDLTRFKVHLNWQPSVWLLPWHFALCSWRCSVLKLVRKSYTSIRNLTEIVWRNGWSMVAAVR